MHRRPTVLVRLALSVWLGAIVGAAALEVARPGDGRVLGTETVVLPGATTLRWRGPWGREAELAGDGRFEVWRHPYWTGTPALPDGARLVVDHALSPAEAIAAATVRHRWVWGAGLLVLAGAILRWGGVAEATVLALALGLLRVGAPWALVSDPLRYVRSAEAILGGHAPDLLWPPLWPALLAAAGAVPIAGRVLGAGLVAACVPLAARLAGGRAAVPAAVVTALSSELVHFGPSLFAEPLYVALGLALLAAESPVRAGLWGALLVGARAQGLAVAPVVLAVRHRGRAALVALGAFALPVVVWSAGASVAAGHLVLVADSAGMNLWIGHRPGADGDWHDPGPPPPEGYAGAAWAGIAADPGAATARVAGNVARLWNASRSDPSLATRPLPFPLLPYAGLVALAALGAIATRRRDLLAWLLVTTVVTALFFVPVRYKLGLYPGLLPFAGLGLAWIGERLGSRAART